MIAGTFADDTVIERTLSHFELPNKASSLLTHRTLQAHST